MERDDGYVVLKVLALPPEQAPHPSDNFLPTYEMRFSAPAGSRLSVGCLPNCSSPVVLSKVKVGQLCWGVCRPGIWLIPVRIRAVGPLDRR